LLKIKRKKNTNFENFEEIQDHSSSNTARIFKSYTIEEKESVKGKGRNHSKEETTYVLTCVGSHAEISQI